MGFDSTTWKEVVSGEWAEQESVSVERKETGDEPMDILEHISGVDEDAAQTLHDHGYHTASAIHDAEQSKIAGIEGIGNALAARMKADVGGLEVCGETEKPFSESVSVTTDFSRELYLADEDCPVVVDDAKEITLKRDGEEKTFEVDELFGKEDMECTCGPNEGCSECPDEKITSIGKDITVTISGKDSEELNKKMEQEIKELCTCGRRNGECTCGQGDSRETCPHIYCSEFVGECEVHQ